MNGISERPTETAPTAGATVAVPRSPRAHSRYRAWGTISYAIVGVYLFLLLVVVFLFPPGSSTLTSWAPWFLILLIVALLARYLTTRYRIDDQYLHAVRFLGGVRVRLERVRRIEYSSLRDLSATAGVFGAWGWRGRMWSPFIGRFSAIYTDPAHGLLVTSVEDGPLYLSPRHPDQFARELSRRVRSYQGQLAVDVGDPSPAPLSTEG